MPKYNLTGSYTLVIFYRRAGAGGGGAEDFFGRGGGITLFLGEQKRGSVVIENPKWEITENVGRIKAEGKPLKFAWKMKTLGGGIAKVIKCY